KLADAEIPVRMTRPLDIKIVSPVEAQAHVLALQFVHNRAVINSPDRNPSAVPLVVKLRPMLLDRLDVDGPDSKHLLRQQKIRQSFLRLWMNLHQDHVLGIMIADNRDTQKFAKS